MNSHVHRKPQTESVAPWDGRQEIELKSTQWLRFIWRFISVIFRLITARLRAQRQRISEQTRRSLSCTEVYSSTAWIYFQRKTKHLDGLVGPKRTPSGFVRHERASERHSARISCRAIFDVWSPGRGVKKVFPKNTSKTNGKRTKQDAKRRATQAIGEENTHTHSHARTHARTRGWRVAV